MISRGPVRTRGLSLLEFLAPRLARHSPPFSSRTLATSATTSTLNKWGTPNPRRTATTREPEPAQSSLVGPANDKADQNLLFYLRALEDALRKRNLAITWQIYCSIVQGRLEHILSRPQVHSLSRLVTSHIDKSTASDVFNEEDRDALNGLAVVAAVRGDTTGLCALMIFYIKGGNPQPVIRLYNAYMEERIARQSALQNQKLSPQSEDIVGNENTLATAKGHRLPVGFADLALLCVTAHAMEDTFDGALQIMVADPSIRFLHSSLAWLAGELEYDPVLKEKALGYAEDLTSARWVAVPEGTFARRVTSLSQERDVEGLAKLYAAILTGYNGPRPWIARCAGEVTNSQPFLVRESAWAALIRAFLFCRREDLAEKLWENMLNFGVEPTRLIWNSLLEGYREMGAPHKLLSAWETMQAVGVQPDSFTFCARIAGLFEQQEKALALTSFEAYKQQFKAGERELAVYNAVLHGLLINSDPLGAQKLLAQMRTEGPHPDIVSYNTFMRYYGRRGDLPHMTSVLSELQAAGQRPDVHTFSTMISAMYRLGKTDVAEKLRTMMRKMGVEENVATYSTIIDQQVKEGTRAGVEAALSTLYEMERMPHIRPNQVTYTALLAGVNRNQELSNEEILENTRYIFEKMASRGIKPNRVTYHILLKSSLENPSTGGLQRAMKYVREMDKKRVPFSHDTWYIILRGLVKREEWGIANEMVDKMFRMEFRPMWGVADYVDQIRRHNR